MGAPELRSWSSFGSSGPSLFFDHQAVLFNNKRPHLSPGGGVPMFDNPLSDKQGQIIAGAGSLMPGGIGVLPGMSGLLGGSYIGAGAS